MLYGGIHVFWGDYKIKKLQQGVAFVEVYSLNANDVVPFNNEAKQIWILLLFSLLFFQFLLFLVGL